MLALAMKREILQAARDARLKEREEILSLVRREQHCWPPWDSAQSALRHVIKAIEKRAPRKRP